MTNFYEDIEKFNEMYGLPHPLAPSTSHLPLVARMKDFKRIITEEVSEVDDIVAKAGVSEIDDLTALADWLGDMIVYCASEMRRFGLPVEQVLHLIMQSNFSKLDENGKPIIRNGKVQKSTLYWKPEPSIRQLLVAKLESTSGMERITGIS